MSSRKALTKAFGAALALKLAGWLGYQVRLVVEAHGDFEGSLFLQRDIRFPGLYRFLMKRLARYSIKQADLLRAISNSTKEQLQALGAGKDNRAISGLDGYRDISASWQNK